VHRVGWREVPCVVGREEMRDAHTVVTGGVDREEGLLADDGGFRDFGVMLSGPFTFRV
jgi:hypothetical protein